MARPSTIKLAEGEVVLRNVPKETMDIIKNFLTNMNSKIETVSNPLLLPNPDLPPVPLEMLESNMQHKGVSLLRREDNMYVMVELSFDLNTKEGQVDKITELDNNKHVAQDMFKVYLARNFF